ncbi:MAG TPA: 3-dehydroquinate synthase [Chlamydiales bacterium]|jgi:3-dehydroquinate synthase|nr:3-dehydroquinate synthase [Chlamydiales bacterium]
MHSTIAPLLSAATTELRVGHNLYQNETVPLLIKKWGHRAVLITDPIVAELYGKQLSAKWQTDLIVVPKMGEAIKSREMKEWIEDQLFAGHYGRDTVLLAVGGGAITDVVGFVASTYLRGIPLLLLPTTLLAIVDAAIGGKTGIDTHHGKNLLGTYYPPKAIIADLSTLKSLPNAEWQNGLAEILKAALIANPALWPLCDNSWRSRLEQIVPLAIQVKIDTIEQDPLEKGLRRILNFGHTVAHALEANACYQIAHGETVAIGLMAESYLSMRMGLLENTVFEQIIARIKGSGFLLQLPRNYDRSKFLSALAYDKKTAKGVIRFTLIEKIGKTATFDGAYCCPVPQELLLDMIDWMEIHCNKKRVEIF